MIVSRIGTEHTLSEHHLEEIVGGSGVSPPLVEGRYFSVGTEEAKALGFSEAQARAGWAVQLLSPTGEISYQLKPDRPRVVKGKPVKYETPAGRDCVIDACPSNLHRLRDASVPLWVTEGTKKADALASRGCLAVALTGVWNWGRKRARGGAKYGRPELLPDWDHIPLEGRAVYIVFDNDYLQRQNVALALLRLCERLTERGAHVYVVSLPPGPDKGVDDYLISGGASDALRDAATPFRPSDLIAHAAKPDERIRVLVSGVLREMATDPRFTDKAATTYSLLRSFAELGLVSGRYVSSEAADVVEIVLGTRDLALYSGIGSRNTLARHTERLIEWGYLERVSGNRHKGQANHYRLKTHEPVPLIERGGEVSTISITGSHSWVFAPHLRWASPPIAEDDPRFGQSGSASAEESMRSLGKRAELALTLLLAWGGTSTIRDLCNKMGVRDTCALRKDLADLCDAGVIGMDPKGKHGAHVWLTDEWQSRLCERQAGGGELARARRQAKKIRDSREAFADRHRPADEAPKEGDMRGSLGSAGNPTVTGEPGHQLGDRSLSEIERARALIVDILSREKLMEHGYIRTGLMREIWTEDEGGKAIHFMHAMRLLKRQGRLTEKDRGTGEPFTYPIAADEARPASLAVGDER